MLTWFVKKTCHWHLKSLNLLFSGLCRVSSAPARVPGYFPGRPAGAALVRLRGVPGSACSAAEDRDAGFETGEPGSLHPAGWLFKRPGNDAYIILVLPPTTGFSFSSRDLVAAVLPRRLCRTWMTGTWRSWIQTGTSRKVTHPRLFHRYDCTLLFFCF